MLLKRWYLLPITSLFGRTFYVQPISPYTLKEVGDYVMKSCMVLKFVGPWVEI